MRRALPFTALSVAALLGGCVVGPHYAKPTPPAPGSQTFTAQSPDDAAMEARAPHWWKLYDDPAIDPLGQDALAHNTGLLQVAAHMAETRANMSQARAGHYPRKHISTGA